MSHINSVCLPASPPASMPRCIPAPEPQIRGQTSGLESRSSEYCQLPPQILTPSKSLLDQFLAAHKGQHQHFLSSWLGSGLAPLHLLTVRAAGSIRSINNPSEKLLASLADRILPTYIEDAVLLSQRFETWSSSVDLPIPDHPNQHQRTGTFHPPAPDPVLHSPKPACLIPVSNLRKRQRRSVWLLCPVFCRWSIRVQTSRLGRAEEDDVCCSSKSCTCRRLDTYQTIGDSAPFVAKRSMFSFGMR